MKTVEIDLIEYKKALDLMDKFIEKVNNTKENILFFCSHPAVFTIGSDHINTDIKIVKSDRGGSITYHDEGCLMVYFIFLVNSPPLFYKKVIKIFQNFFNRFDKKIYYDFKRPGFYIENRKIASLGFRYKNGVSKHGVSLHIDPNLKEFNRIKPCNLDGVVATSFKNENINISKSEAKNILKKLIEDEFFKT